jgi:hypothetical protein
MNEGDIEIIVRAVAVVATEVIEIEVVEVSQILIPPENRLSSISATYARRKITE